MNILMINLPFSGHTNPTLELTKELVQRGHRVTYINAEDFRSKIEETGAFFVPYINYPTNPTEKEKTHGCFAAAYDTAMSLTEKFDLLIYEMFFYPGINVAKRKHIPCVRQFSQPAWSVETWNDSPPMFKLSAKLIDLKVLSEKDARRMGFEHSCLRDGIIKSRPDLNIVYVPEKFQNKRNTFDKSYIFTVPSPVAPKSDIVIPYEKMKHPIVYISLGSIMNSRLFCKECIKGFGGKKMSVILNTGKVPPDSLGNIPKNIYAYSFVPQLEVLEHTDVFLTHCGMNSVNEALYYGVPMAAMPFLNDQIGNAERIVKLGLGKRVRSFPINGDSIYRTVRKVCLDGGIKKRVCAMSGLVRKNSDMDYVIERIEQTVLCNRNY